MGSPPGGGVMWKRGEGVGQDILVWPVITGVSGYKVMFKRGGNGSTMMFFPHTKKLNSHLNFSTSVIILATG